MRRFALLLTLLIALAPQVALACGMPLNARVAGEQALLVVNGSRRELIVSVNLADAGPDAALVLPVPAVPEAVDQPPGGAELFAYLREATAPIVRTERQVRWGFPPDQAPQSGGSVSVLAQQTLGGYEVATLKADEAGSLQRWLDQNGYTTPAGAEPILAQYIADGWSFVAIKLAAAVPDGSLDPLRIRYTSERTVYPQRLGALSQQPINGDLFVLDAGRMDAPGLQTVFAGPVASLDPAPPAAVAPLLQAAPFLTRLQASDVDPATVSGDIVIGPAADTSPFRQEQVVTEEVYLLAAAPGIFFALACLVMITPLSLLGALAIRRRIDRIAPDPDKP